MAFLREVAIAALVALALMPFVHVAYAAWVRRRHPARGLRHAHAGARVHYTRDGSGPAVVLIHGANGTLDDFPPELIAELARDHTVIAMDRPGHGWSEAPRGPLGSELTLKSLLSSERRFTLGPVTELAPRSGFLTAPRFSCLVPMLLLATFSAA